MVGRAAVRSMRGWAVPLLRCVACGGSVESTATEVRCVVCGQSYARRDDVVDFLHAPHPTVARERSAVHHLDSGGADARAEAQSVLRRLERGDLTEEDLRRSAHTRAIAESRAQVLELLAREPLQPGAIVLEIGADSGWASSVLLQAGCRVVAIDITDHLLLSPDGASADLCRLYADMNKIPLGDEAVDVVFAASCLHHSWDLENTFREIARVLKPGGTVYLCGEPMPSLLRFVFGGRFGHAERDLGINETWTWRATWLRICRDAGLRPRILHPVLDERQLGDRLQKRRLPRLLVPVVRSFLPSLQVSVHLIAKK
jgi:SAM-dependent methyltransferase